MRFLAVDPDGPREVEDNLGAVGRALARDRITRITIPGPAEFDQSGANRINDRDLVGEYGRHHARVRVGCAENDAWGIDAVQLRHDPELQDCAEYGIVGVTPQGRRQ